MQVQSTNSTAQLRVELRTEISTLGDRISHLELSIARERVSQMRWMVGLWAAQVTLLVGTVFTVLQAR